MSRRIVRLTSAAEQDLHETRAWFRENAPHLDHEFHQALRETFDDLRMYPRMYAELHRGTRRALIRRFRFAVFYRVAGQAIQVIAILHQARDPQVWKGRLS